MGTDNIGENWFGIEGENNLDVLMSQADLRSEAVDQEKLKKLLKNCKWMGTGYEFLYMAEHTKSEYFRPNRAAILGIGNFYSTSEAMMDHLGAGHWNDKYLEYGIYGDPSERDDDGYAIHTRLFMTKLANDPNVESIIFFVPPKLFSYKEERSSTDSDDYDDFENQNITRGEMVFLLNNPELAKKVYLVFGAYDMVNREKYDDELSTPKDGEAPWWYKDTGTQVLSKAYRKFVESFVVKKEW